MHKLLSVWWKAGLLMMFFAVGTTVMPQENNSQETSTQQEEAAPKKTPIPKPTAYILLPETKPSKQAAEPEVSTGEPEASTSEPDTSSYPSDFPLSYPSGYPSADSTNASSTRPKGAQPTANSKDASPPVNQITSSQPAPPSSETSLSTSTETQQQPSSTTSSETQQPTVSSESFPQSSGSDQTGNQLATVSPVNSTWLLPVVIVAGVLTLTGLVYSLRGKLGAKPTGLMSKIATRFSMETTSLNSASAAALPQVNFKLMPNINPSHAIELISNANPNQTNGNNGSLAMDFDFALTINHGDGGSQTIATISETANRNGNGSNGSLGMNMGMGLKINFDAGTQTFDSAASLLANG